MNALQTLTVVQNNAAIYRFKIGAFDAISISDGQVAFPPYPTYAPNADPLAVERSLSNHFMPIDRYLLNFNALFVDTGCNKVLIDTGAGQALGTGTKLGRLALHLEQAGISPVQVDTVILSHGHPDHIGGLIRPARQLQFPNAQHFIAETEWQFWTADQIDFGGMRIDDGFKQVFIATIDSQLRPLAKQVTQFTPDRELVPGIHAIAAPGHTPGHCAILVSSGDSQLLHVADTFHSQAFDLDHPDWATAFDHDPDRAHLTRLRLLDQAASDRTLLMAYHMPFPGIGYIRNSKGRYDWSAAAWLFD